MPKTHKPYLTPELIKYLRLTCQTNAYALKVLQTIEGTKTKACSERQWNILYYASRGITPVYSTKN